MLARFRSGNAMDGGGYTGGAGRALMYDVRYEPAEQLRIDPYAIFRRPFVVSTRNRWVGLHLNMLQKERTLATKDVSRK